MKIGDRVLVVDGLAGFNNERFIGLRGAIFMVERQTVGIKLDNDPDQSQRRWFGIEFVRPLDAVELLAELA